jgi:hypothetical protein
MRRTHVKSKRLGLATQAFWVPEKGAIISACSRFACKQLASPDPPVAELALFVRCLYHRSQALGLFFAVYIAITPTALFHD